MITLRTYLDQEDLTCAAFGGRIGVDGTTVSRWCTGDIYPRKQQLEALARETGMQAVIVAGEGVRLIAVAPAPCPEGRAA